MKSLSVKLVLVTVLLQLSLSVLEVNAGGGAGGAAGGPVGELVQNENDLRFGDLLVFPGEGYNHYAVYVGNVQFDGKTAGQNIFHMTNGCRFDIARAPFRRHNYLDQDLPSQNINVMRETIQNLMNSPVCRTYSLYTKNCEQIATRVRYGEARCKQLGTDAAKWARILPRPSIKRREASAAA
ncbi:hypothetical protein ABG768_017785 [Culter alburnus]|uniref:LRAT domain-containing protein n=1 Tax=Culter alburnus TaxID=194366 RepID=A0AAW1YTZ2_CULAL